MNQFSPIAIFDSGVGSYSIVRVIRKLLPKENIIYLADRASFPYGGKTHEEMKQIVLSSINFLEKNYQPKVIVIASNTPSIQVLDEVKNLVKISLVGVFPPVEQAAKISRTKHIAILATKNAVESQEIDAFIKKLHLARNIKIHKVNASPMVSLVESGIFQSDKKETEKTIKATIDTVLQIDSEIDVMTLSSTHLPFLLDYLTNLYPAIKFLDPAEDLAEQIKKYLINNNLSANNAGSLKVIATIDKQGRFQPDGLKNILKILGLDTHVYVVNI